MRKISNLSAPSLDHKLSREMRGRLRYKRLNLNGPIKGVTGYDLPVVKNGHAEGLTLRVCSQVGLKTE